MFLFYFLSLSVGFRPIGPQTPCQANAIDSAIRTRWLYEENRVQSPG